MTGTPSQIEWAGLIKPRVNAEFERIAKAFNEVAEKQSGQDRMDTLAIVEILQKKRAHVMAQDQAGDFIRDWQELRDQVRQMLSLDPEYQAIKAAREARGTTLRAQRPVVRC